MNSSAFQLSGSSAEILYGGDWSDRHFLDSHAPFYTQQIERSKRLFSCERVDDPNERDARQAWRKLSGGGLVDRGEPEVLADGKLCEPPLVSNDQPGPRRWLRGLLLSAVLHLVPRRELDPLRAPPGIPLGHQQHCDRRLPTFVVHGESTEQSFYK